MYGNLFYKSSSIHRLVLVVVFFLLSGCDDETSLNNNSDSTNDNSGGTSGCTNDESLIVPFTCEEAVASFGCDSAWNTTTIEEACPESCDLCDSVTIYYNTDTPVGGFQFNVNNVVVTDADGGAATAAGFNISVGNNILVLGFSLSGSTIPAGDGVLVVLEVDGNANDACLSGVIISGSAGASLSTTISDCTTINIP